MRRVTRTDVVLGRVLTVLVIVAAAVWLAITL